MDLITAGGKKKKKDKRFTEFNLNFGILENIKHFGKLAKDAVFKNILQFPS